MVSTPNAPGGLFQRIEQEPIETCLYKKFFLDYLWGVGKIYTQEEIDKAKLSPSFPREYELEKIDNSAATNIKPKKTILPRSIEGLMRPGVKITELQQYRR